MAALFTGQESVQDVINLAVTEFLDRLRSAPGFVESLATTEHEQQRRGRVPPMKGENAAPNRDGDADPDRDE
jgi:hypothetical protein